MIEYYEILFITTYEDIVSSSPIAALSSKGAQRNVALDIKYLYLLITLKTNFTLQPKVCLGFANSYSQTGFCCEAAETRYKIRVLIISTCSIFRFTLLYHFILNFKRS